MYFVEYGIRDAYWVLVCCRSVFSVYIQGRAKGGNMRSKKAVEKKLKECKKELEDMSGDFGQYGRFAMKNQIQVLEWVLIEGGANVG